MELDTSQYQHVVLSLKSKYADEQLQINLAISLHAPNNEVRDQLMPINKAYPIEQVVDAIRYYMTKTNRRITIEYILIDELNDQKEHALELVKLLKRVKRVCKPHSL